MANAAAQSLIDSLAHQGVVNPFVQAGVIGVVGTESDFVPKSEITFRNTPNDIIHNVFKNNPGFVNYMRSHSEADLTKLKTDDIAFFDVVYGGLGGNTSKGDGWKYRARGYNGITFKDAYRKYGNMIGVDLVSNPDLLNQPDIAAKVAGIYFADTFKTATANGSLKAKIGVNNLSEIKDQATGTKAALQANAGFRTNLNVPFYQDVYKKAMSFITQNPVKTGATLFVLVMLFFLIYKLASSDNE